MWFFKKNKDKNKQFIEIDDSFKSMKFVDLYNEEARIEDYHNYEELFLINYFPTLDDLSESSFSAKLIEEFKPKECKGGS